LNGGKVAHEQTGIIQVFYFHAEHLCTSMGTRYVSIVYPMAQALAK